MEIDELLASAHYVVDDEGRRTAVQLNLTTWENIVALLRQPNPDTKEIDQPEASAWESFMQTLADSVVDTGIADLAAEHDHYLYGKPKRNRL